MTKYRANETKRALLLLCLPAMIAACGGAGGEAIGAPEQASETVAGGSIDNGTGEPSDPSSPGTDPSAPGAPSVPGATPAPETPPAAETPAPSGPMPFRGVNVAGGEFGAAIPGVEGRDYRFPTPESLDYFIGKGMNTFRVGFLWERLQPQANGDFVPEYLSRIDALVTHATGKGAYVILNPHNFARYYGATVGSSRVPSSVFANLWTRLAERYRDNPHVMFNLVNEPHDLPMNEWVDAAQAAVTAIRATGAQQTIITPGNAWTGAHSWVSSGNATAMLNVTDPSDNMLYEVHQYLDSNSSGGGACVSSTIGRERMKPFVDWLRANGKKGFVGELGVNNNATCNAAMTDMFNYLMESSDVLQGWLWWAAGPGWGEYSLTIEPKNGQDRPQMALIEPFLVR